MGPVETAVRKRIKCDERVTKLALALAEVIDAVDICRMAPCPGYYEQLDVEFRSKKARSVLMSLELLEG